MRVIVTRPEPECSQWAGALQARGLDAVALPLIELCDASDDVAICGRWRGLARYHALMFVSRAAVQHFFSRRPASQDAALFGCGGRPRFWATGPGTFAALVRQGVDAARIDTPDAASGQFDSEALWAVVGGQALQGRHVLIVRGADASIAADSQGSGRDWLAGTLEQAGAAVDFVVAYQRRAPLWHAAQQRLARTAARDGSVWLFTSSQAIGHLAVCLPGQQWTNARALATHARIAQVARETGFGVVWESRPRIEDVVASIESVA